MKVLLINHTDSGGGAAVAAYNLVNKLRKHNIDADLGVVEKKTNCPFVIELPRKYGIFYKVKVKIIKKTEKILNMFFKTTNRIPHSFNNYSIINVDWINNSDYDLVNLHWINGNTLSIKDISKIKKPIIWTLHDSWPCCGAEHHPNVIENDKRYMQGYYRSNKPASTKGLDLCRFVYNIKVKYFPDKNISFIAPSNWEKGILDKSCLFKDSKCTVVPNIINEEIFYKRTNDDIIIIKKTFAIPVEKKIICFGAAYTINDPFSLKGGQYLIKALEKLKNKENYFLLIFGPANSTFSESLNMDSLYTGYIHSPQILASLYNCSDVFVCPSIIENLPYTCLEAQSSGIPVAAFNTGGIPDIVTHMKTGYLAEKFNVQDLADGILYCLENKQQLGENALKKIKRDFDSENSIRKYIDVYNKKINFSL